MPVPESLILLARDNFEEGEYGYAMPDGVRRMTGGLLAKGATLVTALEHVNAGAIGRFREWLCSQYDSRAVAEVPSVRRGVHLVERCTNATALGTLVTSTNQKDDLCAASPNAAVPARVAGSSPPAPLG
jgi:hypothetical protein